MKKFLVVIILITATFLLGCSAIHSNSVSGSGEYINKSYNQKGFNKIVLSNAISLNIKQGNIYNIKVRMDKSFANYLNIEVKNKTFYAYLDRGNTYNDSDIEIDMVVPGIEYIKLSSASSLYMDDFKLSEITIQLSGASNLEGNIEADEINITGSGASNLKLRGETDKIEVNISGASDGYLEELTAKEAIFSVSGASDLKLNVEDKIQGTVSGASDLEVYGNPKIKNFNTSGVSDIKFK